MILSGINEQYTQSGIKRVSVNVDLIAFFVITINVGVMINAGVNANN